MKIPAKYIGKWRIYHMDEWDEEYIDMEETAYLKINKDGTGQFQFGLVTGEIDGRIEIRKENERIEFSWSGFDENDAMSGRGWAEVNKKEMNGWIYIHLGDDSGFKALKK
ncbi:MAG: hypothetical protein HZA15_05260 [Nitrospirae bacterium]|nr:hypothetical protein [Nitrospirota bacterium]